MHQVTQYMSFLLPEHFIKAALLESVKYSISNMTAKQLLLTAALKVQRPAGVLQRKSLLFSLLPARLCENRAAGTPSAEPCLEHPLTPTPPA